MQRGLWFGHSKLILCKMYLKYLPVAFLLDIVAVSVGNPS